MRYHRPQLAVAVGIFLAVLILAVLSATSGCRTCEIGTICLIIPETVAKGQLAAITITQTLYAGDIDAQQGKTVSPETSLAASIAATLRDITAAQGDATRTGESGASENAAESAAPIVGATHESPAADQSPTTDTAPSASSGPAAPTATPAAGQSTDNPAAVAAPVVVGE